jgi:putative two-component system response regulator
LVVEDNAPTREGLAAVLLRAGYLAQPAADGRQALHELTTGPRPDLILLDLVMPGLDGWHFLERLRQLGPPAVPVIITSGTSLSGGWAEAHGCQGFLAKPIEPDLLLQEVQRCLGHMPVGSEGEGERSPTDRQLGGSSPP